MKKKWIFILLIIIILVAVVCFIFLGNKDKETANDNNTENNNQIEQKENDDKENNNDTNNESNAQKTLNEIADELAISFGTYNGESIAWKVLHVDEDNARALLITKDVIEQTKFHDEENLEDLTWRTSDLRVWLIGDFHSSSFTSEEKEKIFEVENPQDTNSETGAKEPDGYETTDTVFILSATEMLKYFDKDEDMAATYNGEPISYWTRTPGNDTTGYVCTYSDGGLYMTGNRANSTTVGVRPAIWVNLSTDESE